MFLRDHADDISGPRYAPAANDERHECAFAPNSLDDFEGDIIFTHDREIAARGVVKNRIKQPSGKFLS